MKISEDTYYNILCRYILAKKRQLEVDELEQELHQMLNLEIGTHISDAIYSYDKRGTQAEFDELLNLMGVEVKPEW